MAFDVGAITARLELNKKQWEQSIEKVKGDQRSLQGFILRNEQQIKSLGRSLTVVGGLVTTAFGLLIRGTVNYGDKLNDLSKRTGIATETLSAYKLAADKSGTSLEGLATGMRGLANKMQEANSGAKEGQKLFKALGIEYRDAEGKLRPLDQIMLDVADRFAGMEDGAEKTALAVDIFGRSGMELIPMLNMGRKGLEENAEAARKLGIVWSTEAAKKADEFNDSIAELKAGLSGTGREIATALMPIIKNLIDKTRDITIRVREWIAEHPTLTSWIVKLTAGGGALALALGPIVIALPQLVRSFTILKALDIGGKLAGGFFTLAIAIGATYAAIKVLEALRENWEKRTGHFVDAETKGWTKVTEAIGGWSTFAENAARAHVKSLNEMMAVWDKYEQNTREALKAIAEGKEGKELQDFLNGIIGQHKEATSEIEKLNRKTKDYSDLLEKFKATTIPGLQTKLQDLINLWVTYKDKLPFFEQQRIRKEIEETQKVISQGLKPALADLARFGPVYLGEVEEAVASLSFSFYSQAIAALRNTAHSAYETALQVVNSFEWAGGKMEKAVGDVVPQVKSFMQEVSTVVSDAMRNIARSIVDVFNFKNLFGAIAIDVKFDSSAFDAMVDAAKTAYDKITDAARKSFDQQELQISRAEEDADIRYEREYERQRKSIANSSMTEKQKEDALLALEIQYETAKLARERAREDARYARERDQKAKLLQMEKDHEIELQKIKDTEDKARQKLADDEEKRQNSLWFKVKGIVATAFEEITTSFMTKMFEPIGSAIGKLAGKLVGKGADTVTGALAETGKSVGSLGKTIGDFIGGIGTGIGQFIAGLATGIATAIVAIATAIATAATTLAAAAPAIAIVAALGLAIYSGILQIKTLWDKVAGFGKGAADNASYWLKLMWETETNILNWTIGGITKQLEDYVKAPMVEKFDALKASVDLTRDQMIPRLDKIVEYTSKLKDLTKAQHGFEGTVTRPTMFMAGEAGPERVTITPHFKLSAAPIHVHVRLEGKEVALAVAKYAPELSRDGALKIHQRALLGS